MCLEVAQVSSWWAGLPGTDISAPVANERLANRVVAAACAAHVLHVDPGQRGWLGQVPATADRFLGWLEDTRSAEDGCVRRVALCIACTDAGPGMRSQVLDTAKAVYRWMAAGSKPAAGWRDRWSSRTA